MRKVELRMNEQNKYEIIKKLVDTNGNKKRAATKLGCTVRTINRLIIKYKEQGKKGFVHGNRGRLPASTVREFDSCLHFFTNQIAQNVDYINAFEFFLLSNS